MTSTRSLITLLLLTPCLPTLADTTNSSDLVNSTSHHPDGVQCHKPNLEAAIDHYYNLSSTENQTKYPKFIEYSCVSKRYGRCTHLGGIGNKLIIFPAVYLAAMLTGRELIIRDNSELGHWCHALKCGFHFSSYAEMKFPQLQKTTRVHELIPGDFAEKLRTNTSIPHDIVSLRALNVFASTWYLHAGPLASECVERITGDYNFISIVNMEIIGND